MSSTYFRNVRVVKTVIFPWKNSNYTENIYALFFETAESNVRNFNGGLCWHEWLYKVGTYESIMREVCHCSFDFETRCSQWKPANKTPEGFIHTCRNAIKNAAESATLNHDERFIFINKKDAIAPIIEKIGELEGVDVSTSFDDYYAVRSSDIALMYWIDQFVGMCKDNYLHMTPIDFAKNYCNNENVYFNCEQIVALFKEDNVKTA